MLIQDTIDIAGEISLEEILIPHALCRGIKR